MSLDCDGSVSLQVDTSRRDCGREQEQRRRGEGERWVGAAIKEGREKRERVDSLGWLTESAVLPKQQRAMEGVGPASLVEVRAHLYRTHEDFNRARELGLDPNTFHPKKKLDVFLLKNSGVEERSTSLDPPLSLSYSQSFS